MSEKKLGLILVESYLDAFGNTVRAGDTIIYYSGNTGTLVTGIVKTIKNAPRKYRPTALRYLIRTEEGGKIENEKITMKK